MFLESPIADIYCMADHFCRNLLSQEKKYMIEDKGPDIATSPTV